MPETLGARLRQKREEQQIDLSAVAADTKIKLSLLEGLERDDVSGWPTGIFRRAYVRAYARALRIPPDEVVAEFVATHPEPDTSNLPLSASFPESAEPESWRERIWSFGRRAADEPRAPNAAAALSAAQAPVITGPPTSDLQGPPAPASSASAAMASETVDVPAPLVGDDPVPAVAPVDSPDAASFEPDLAAIAQVCTQLGQVADATDLAGTLEACATVLKASGMIVWLWDCSDNALVAAFTHGYPREVLAHLQPISDDSDNATAATFRSGEVCVVPRTARQNGALVAPLMRAGGCIGVLAMELQDGVEQMSSVGHIARILAAQLATLFDAPPAETAAEPVETPTMTGEWYSTADAPRIVNGEATNR